MVFLLVLWSGAVCAHAHAAPTPIPVGGAVDSALTRNPEILLAREKLEEIKALVPQAISLVFPTISGTGEASYRKDALTRGSPLFGGEPYNYYTLGLQFSQPLYRGDAIWSGYLYVRRQVVIQALELAQAERDLSVRVIQAYYAVLFAERTLLATTESVEVQKEFLATVRSRYKIGREQELTVLQAGTQLSLLEPKVAQAQNDLKIARSQLEILMGVEEGGAARLSATLEPPSWAPVASALTGGAYQPPELVRAEQLSAQFESKRSVALSKHFPQLDAVVSLNNANTQKTKLLDSESNAWAVALQLKIPIFTGLSSVFERRQLAAQQRELEFDEGKIKDTIHLSRVQTETAIELSQRLLEANRSAVSQARAASKLARRSYALGTATYLQFFEAQRNLLDAELGYARAQYDAVLNMAKYFAAHGWPLKSLVQALGGGEGGGE